MTFEFPEPVYIHALLIVLDIVETITLQNFEIKITNKSSYIEDVQQGDDPLCDGNHSIDLASSKGIELWPHCTGKYIHIYTRGTTINPPWKTSICTVAAFGSIYERSVPLPSSYTYNRGQVNEPLVVELVKPRAGFEPSYEKVVTMVESNGFVYRP